MTRVCRQCGKELHLYQTGNLCHACQEKRLEKMITDDEDLVEAEGYADMLGLDSAEQLKRIARDGLLAPRIPVIRQWRWRRKDIEAWFKQEQRVGDVFRTVARGIASNLRTCCNARMGQTLSDKIGDIVYGLKAGEYFFGLTAARQVESIELLNVNRSIAVKMLERLPKKDFPELIGITDWADLTYGSINEDLIIRLDTYF